MKYQKALNIVVMLLITTVLTITMTTSATLPPPVCDTGGPLAYELIREDGVLGNLSNFVLANADNITAGTYDPILHAKLIDCDCARILDTRSKQQMMAVFDSFCKGRQFDSIFEPLMVRAFKSGHGFSPEALSLDYCERVPASVLVQDQCQLTKLSTFLTSMGDLIGDGSYDPILHARLIDCGCATIVEYRWKEQMVKPFHLFCEGKQFYPIFETLVKSLLAPPLNSLLFRNERVWAVRGQGDVSVVVPASGCINPTTPCY